MLNLNRVVSEVQPPNTYGTAVQYYHPLVLDRIGGAKMALALRALKSQYNGNYATLRKQDSSEEQKVCFPYKGLITPLSLLENGKRIAEWASETKGSIWYDQSGNRMDAFQGIATQQYYFTQDARHRSFFMSRTKGDYKWNFSPLLSPYLYGEGKCFTFHSVTNSWVSGGGDYRLFYHINSSYELFNGFTLLLHGVAQSGYYHLLVLMGDMVNCCMVRTTDVFLNTYPLHLIVRYDGTVTTSWKDRLTITANGKQLLLDTAFSAGEFPAALAQPLSTAKNWAALSSVNQSGMAEIIFWDRLLSDNEVDFLARQTQTVYGI